MDRLALLFFSGSVNLFALTVLLFHKFEASARGPEDSSDEKSLAKLHRRMWRKNLGSYDFDLRRLSYGYTILIGRAWHADIALVDKHLSRCHARLGCWRGRVIIWDLGSENGTWLNNQRINCAVLEPGDVLRVGESSFVFKPSKGNRNHRLQIYQEETVL